MFNDPKHHILVDEEAGVLVSSCILLIVPNLTHGQRPYGVIENVVTDRAFRGQGRASAVLRAAKLLAQARNCYKLMLMTGSKEASTLNFYRRAGFNTMDKTAFVQWLNP
ncbi:GNAT family N-acetyltransferase [Caproiciproducens sp. LBM24188]